MKNKKIKLFISCIILIILTILIMTEFYFNSLKTKPKEIFISTINDVFEKITIPNDLNSFMTDINLKVNLTSNNEDIKNMLDIINNADVNFNFNIDYNSKTIQTLLSANYNKDELLNISTSIEENGLYVNLKDIYDKTVVIPIKKHSDYVTALFNQNDIKNISKSLNSAINNSLKDKYFVKKNTKVSLNGTDVKVTKNTLTLNNSNLNNIINNIKEDLNNNEEFINSLCRVLNETSEEIKKRIDSINNDSLDEIITISIYTKDNKLMGFEVAKTSNTGLSLSVLKVDDTNYDYELKNNVNSYKGNLEATKSDNNVNLRIYINNSDDVKGTVDININYDKNKEIDEFVKNDTVEIENITDQERLEIFNNIQQKQSIRTIIKDLWNLFEI